MKSGKLFWGFFLLALGTLFLFDKYSVINTNFDFIWDIWPLIFVFWGALVILKENAAKPVASALFGVFIALLFYGFIYNTFWSFDYDYDSAELNFNESYFEDYNPEVKYANLTISSGVSYITIKDLSDKLVEGKTAGFFGEYDFDTQVEDSVAYIDFNLHKKRFNFFKDRIKNRLDVSLNQSPVWDFDLNLGASKSKFDLKNFRVRNFDLETGATSTTIIFGDKFDSTNVDVQMGAASLTIEIPRGSGCELRGEMTMIAKNLDDFTKQGDAYYVTENFDKAKKKLFIKIDGGVASLDIKRY